ncbi:MAG: ABC transporter substrate-binding protein [Lachnospiraceae bacterium]|nr:ABC transporter substrate-binding protein [Lachnospiraceae bacterium]
MSRITIVYRKNILCFVLVMAVCCAFFCVGCKNKTTDTTKKSIASGNIKWDELKKTGEMELKYADMFSVDYYGDYSLVTIADSEKYLLIPKKGEVPANLDEDIVPIKLPLKNSYVASSASMDLFREIGALSNVKMTGTKIEDWSIDEIKEYIDSGKILYGGKYSAPDYEMILENNCDVAIESTMIFHTPKVKEELENIGIPVMVERLSYEKEPLGRVEWIKLFGLMSGRLSEAEKFMEECSKRYEDVVSKVSEKNKENKKKKVAFFYISSNGYVNVRKPGDYISKMIDIAGGSYAFSDYVPDEENALSTMNLQMEAFYEGAYDADYIIYNSTIDGEISTVDELIGKCEVLKDFKAIKNGNAWCTGKNMFQETTGTIGMIEDLFEVINENNSDELKYLHRLK